METSQQRKVSASRAAQRRSSPTIDCSPLAMVEVEGTDHVVCFVNDAFARLVQRPKEELVGMPFRDLVHNGDKCIPALDRIYETGTFATHVEPDASLSTPAYWLYAMWPSLGADETPERVVIQLTRSANYHQNVQALNEALLTGSVRQHELREQAETSNRKLQNEITERELANLALSAAIEDLKKSQSDAERGSRAKDDFLAALSHELRTPLAPVLLIAAALLEDERLPADIKEQVAAIERNVALEARLIDDLLDLTKISQGKLQFRSEKCDAHELIGLAVAIVRSDALAKGVEVEMSLRCRNSEIVADPTRFQQVVWNLLRNAVKFTPRGGKISVSTSDIIGKDGGAWLELDVVDTGIGIQPERLEQIFLPFDQGGLTGDHRFGGVGLGLAIARAVVELHGGRIFAQSAGRDRGSTITAILPRTNTPDPENAIATLLPSTALPSQVVASEPGRSRALHLLLVEDHVNTLQALQHLLERDGHCVVGVSSVAAGLTAAAEAKFDLVISDLGLPDASGNALMRQLRDLYGLRGIALSGYGMDSDVATSHEAGFVAHIVKPVHVGELRRILAAVTHDFSHEASAVT